MPVTMSPAPSVDRSRPDDLKQVSDGDLLDRLHHGDDAAATEIHVRYTERLERLVRTRWSRQLASHLEVEDIVQSAFRRFFTADQQGAYVLPDGEELWKLLLVITLNRLRAEETFCRAAKRDVRLNIALEAMTPGDHSPCARSAEDPTLLRLVVREALGQLPPLHRQAVELRMSGHEVNEIAVQLQRSKRTIERVLQEALTHLRAELCQLVTE